MIPTMTVSGFRRSGIYPKHLIMGQAKACHIEQLNFQQLTTLARGIRSNFQKGFPLQPSDCYIRVVYVE